MDIHAYIDTYVQTDSGRWTDFRKFLPVWYCTHFLVGFSACKLQSQCIAIDDIEHRQTLKLVKDLEGPCSLDGQISSFQGMRCDYCHVCMY